MLWIVLGALYLGVLFYHYASLAIFAIGLFFYLLLISVVSSLSWPVLTILWLFYGVIFVCLGIYPLRCRIFTRRVFDMARDSVPSISATEKDALQAGTVGWEAQLFSGNPDWQQLLKHRSVSLTDEEQAFIDGPLQTLCDQIDDWHFTHDLTDLPDAVWQFIKDNGFLGMIIPKRYGGLEFSAWAHAMVLIKLYSRSIGLATTVSVPNSLGPAELILKYGTEQQKKHYLPRLAKGEDIPCFALTAPSAGSDAVAIPDTGIVCRGTFAGEEIIGIRLNWNKRYITLAPVATLLGLAFKLYDPEHLLSSEEERGITCALIPTNLSGIEIGRRHFPLNTAFMNGPTQGHDVFIPLDWVIGGVQQIGQGWRMLMECLSVGRAISLPSSAVGGSKAMAFASTAYARIRRQFGVPLSSFEGIIEPLARVIGYTYINDSLLRLTVAAIDEGEKPALASAITKYYTTEYTRLVVNDAMDIHAGKGICLGPSNYIGRLYQGGPIGITVEGANILTRSLIIFGQGAIRCHPYVFTELEALADGDMARFDKALFAHIGYIACNQWRSFILAVTAGRLTTAPKGANKRYYQLLTRYCAAFAFVAESSMLALGGNLKRKEFISGRLADVLSMLYIASSVLKRFIDEGEPQDDQVIVDWTCQQLLFNAQQALSQVITNFPNRLFKWVMRAMVFPFGRHLSPPSDELSKQIVLLMTTSQASRQRLYQGVDDSDAKLNPMGYLQTALEKVMAAEPIEKTLNKAIRASKINATTRQQQWQQAVELNIISTSDLEILVAADEARAKVIAVDDFADEQLRRQ